MKNQSISDYVVLAEISYTDLSSGKILDAISEETGSEVLSKYITDRYDVIAHHHDQAGDGFFTSDILNGSGFSATLFQDKVSKAYVLALKGSKGAQDLLGADLNDIVFDGLAYHQIMEMYNFWQSLTQTEYYPASIRTDWVLTAEYAAKRLAAFFRCESYKEAT